MANVPEIDPNDRMMDYDAASRGGTPRWGRRILTGLIAVAALGGFAMIVVYSFGESANPNGPSVPPIVKALDGPTRVKPAEPGGMKIPDQDKQVFARIDPSAPKKTVERLLPPPARVVDGPPPARPGSELELSPAQVPAPPPVPKPPPEVAAVPPAPPAATMPEKPVENPVAAIPVPPVPAAEPAPQPKAPSAAAKAAAAVAPAAGGFRVQLVALRSEAAARTAWAGYVKQHADLFGTLKPTVAKAEIKGKGTFYRLQAGPLADDGAARALCAQIRKRKIGCLVVKP